MHCKSPNPFKTGLTVSKTFPLKLKHNMQDITRTNKLINIRFYWYTVVQNGCSFVLHPVISICNKEIEIIYQTIWERRMLIVMGKSFIGLRLTSLDSIRRADTDVFMNNFANSLVETIFFHFNDCFEQTHQRTINGCKYFKSIIR